MDKHEKHGDVYGEWASRLTTEEIEDEIRYLSVVHRPYDRSERELAAYKLRRLRQELEKREESVE